MATQKAIQANPVKNNSGATLGEGTFSKLNTTGLGNTPTSGPGLGRYQSVALQIQTTPLISGIHVGGKVEDFYRTQLVQYSSKPVNFNVFTNQPASRVNSTDTFVLDDSKIGNNNSAYWYHVGKPQHFRYVDMPSYLADFTMLSSEVNGSSATRTATMMPTKLAMSIFTGSVNPTGNVDHEKTFTVTKVDNGATSSSTYSVPAWSKFNMNFNPTVTSVTVSTNDDINEGFKLGFGASLSQATTTSRTATIANTNYHASALVDTPLTINRGANLTLSSTEKAIKLTASGNIVYQSIIQEVDPQGNKSAPVYQIVPSGLSMVYYPVYKSLVLSDVYLSTFNVDILT